MEVIGYNPLTEDQKKVMNEIKTLGNEIGFLLDRISIFDNEGFSVDLKSLEIAKKEIQTGLMWANRAIAKPSTFC